MPNPMTHDVIVNGDFSQPPSGWTGQSWTIVGGNALPGWTGTEIEWGQQSNYLAGGSVNYVIEMDGNGGSAVTVLQQTFTVSGSTNAVLSFDSALRTAANGNAGQEGFRVDILDSQGTVIQAQTLFPTQNYLVSTSVTVSLPLPGDYTLRFTELGPNDSLGAIIDNVKLLVCFVAGTLIDTPDGPRLVETLRPGDMVSTEDAGPQPVLWSGSRCVTLAELMANPRLRPIHFAPGSLGRGLPQRVLAVSPQHRILRTGWQCELHFGLSEVLVPAHRLVNGADVRIAAPQDDVTYVHFMCEGHQIVRAEGVAAESFNPTVLSLQGVDEAARQEIFQLFPQLATDATEIWQIARPLVRGTEASLVG